MDRIFFVRLWVTTSLAAFFVSFSYEFKSLIPCLSVFPSFLLAIIAFILGTTLSNILVNRLIKSRKIRRFLLGNSWIEGYWFIETKGVEEKDHPLKNPGILFLEYKVVKGSLKAITTRYNHCETEDTVVSHVAYARTDDDYIQ